jgi:hypothetical protein
METQKGNNNTQEENENALATDKSSNSKYIVPIVMGIIAIALYATSFGLTTRSLGNADNWKNIKENITKPIILTAIAGLVLYIALAIYLHQIDSTNSKYIILGIACAGLFCSYFAIGLAAIVKG